MNNVPDLIETIAKVGRQNSLHPPVSRIEPFAHFFKSDGTLDYENLDRRDGSCTRRELILRFLVLCAVVDQGPDIVGVRKLLIDVTNSLYQQEVRFLHSPLEFFREMGVAIDQILEKHQTIKNIRSEIWGRENQANPERYNLFMDNSRQVLNYAVFRWGVPLALPLLLERDCADSDKKPTVLLDFLESWDSAEKMSQELKDNERYGLGKAIGDKACHLFAKWMVSSFKLARRTDISWGDFSFEVPYDSNAGRVLWRTGFLLKWTSKHNYAKHDVIRRGQGKQGSNYIRVTNIRGMSTTKKIPSEIRKRYVDIAVNHLRTHSRPPRKVEIQRIQHAYLLDQFKKTGLRVADFDDGLIHIGTSFCFNHANPKCGKCPLRKLCEGNIENRELITDYRT